MTDAPKEIWVAPNEDYLTFGELKLGDEVYFDTTHYPEMGCTKYIHNDHHKAEVDAAYTRGLERAAEIAESLSPVGKLSRIAAAIRAEKDKA